MSWGIKGRYPASYLPYIIIIFVDIKGRYHNLPYIIIISVGIKGRYHNLRYILLISVGIKGRYPASYRGSWDVIPGDSET